MIKITLQEVIDSVPTRWKHQYARTGMTDKLILTRLLEKLIPPLKAEDVNKIIGNSSWTTLKCNECKKYVDTVIQLGDEPDYESSTAMVCIPCLKVAIKMSK